MSTLAHDRYFDSDPKQKAIALELYEQVKDLPLICPHGHVDPALFSEPNYRFGSPTELLITPDHYVFRMLYSQGISLESLGIPLADGAVAQCVPDEEVWQIFADHFYLFRGTPTGMWLAHELVDLFGVSEKLTSHSAMRIYEQINDAIAHPDFTPRKLYKRFNIEVLATTDPVTSTLEQHKAIQESEWDGDIRPTYRPDALINIDAEWRQNIDELSQVSGITIHSYAEYIRALEERRTFFKAMGATATDHSMLYPKTERLTAQAADELFQRALKGERSVADAQRFTAHMLMEMARMSSEDGLVMQLHSGTMRNHNQALYNKFGPDKGSDIPIANEFTRNLQPLLHEYGSHPNFRFIVFMLDESTLSRELAPLAGHYPALRLGPPWWFFDSWNGMMRFRELVSETAGLYNTVGFNDDTRAFPSIPARHDLARRVDANWLANLVVRHVIDMADAEEMIEAAAYTLAKQAYKFE